MTAVDFRSVAPLVLLSAAPVVVLLGIAVKRNHRASRAIAIASLAAALFAAVLSLGAGPQQITELVRIDGFGVLYMSMILITTMVLMGLGKDYLDRRESQADEYYVLLLLAAAGACVMAVSTHFASFYLSLEILSVSLYGLVAYVRTDKRATEASLKYLIMAAASAAFLLFGMALVYAELGTMSLTALAHATPAQTENRVVLLGVAMMFVSIGFKLSIVPFHLWTADVYEGASAPVTAFAATVSKMSILAVLVRYFSVDSAPVSESLLGIIALTAAASMIVGNLLALAQNNIKRMLAFSSVAHMGYLSVAFLCGGARTHETIAIYLVAYAAATLAAFGVITCMSAAAGGREMERLGDFRGLFWTDPLAATVLSVAILSLAGMPLTAGFLGKFYVIAAGAETPFWWLLVLLALASAAGAWYYLRLIVHMASRDDGFGESGTDVPRRLPASGPRDAVLIALTAATIILGVYPAPLVQFVQAFAAH